MVLYITAMHSSNQHWQNPSMSQALSKGGKHCKEVDRSGFGPYRIFSSAPRGNSELRAKQHEINPASDKDHEESGTRFRDEGKYKVIPTL